MAQRNRKMIRYRKNKKTKIITNCRNDSAEPGDLFLEFGGSLFRIYESNGWHKKMLGELSMRKIHPPKNGMIAVLVHGDIYWLNEKETK